MTRRIVIVGASLAGLRTAEALRRHGHRGWITIIGAEPDLPYDRPPLSKQLLSGTLSPADVALPIDRQLHAEWLLGAPAISMDLDTRSVQLADGRAVPYDALVLATGARARPWSADDVGGRPLTLRTRTDAIMLRDRLQAGGRLLVIGAGFLGGEVAAAGITRGMTVVLLERQALPMRSLGVHIAQWTAAAHREAGVDLRLGVDVRRLLPGPAGLAGGAVLRDGSLIEADTVVVALGAVANSEWLADSGLLLDGGVVCDSWCRPLLSAGGVGENMVVVGDLARLPHPFAPGVLTLGHWSNATEQAAAAARTLRHGPGAPPYVPVPSFWADLHGRKLRSVGMPSLATASAVTETHGNGTPAVVRFWVGDDLVGGVTIDRTSRLAGLRAELQHRLVPRTEALLPG